MVHTYDIRNKEIYRYVLLKEIVKLHQLPTSFQVNFEVCLKGFRKFCAHIAKLFIRLFHIIIYFAVILQASWHTADGN